MSPTSFRSHGFSLLEVLVALVVLSIGLLGIAAMQASALASTHGSQTESLVTIEARSIADAMIANSDYWGGGHAPASFTVTGTAAAPTISDTTLSSQATDCTTSSCNYTQMAGYDVQHWASELMTQIPGATATIACQAGAPVVCTITVNWTQKATTAINKGTTSTATATSQSYTLVNQI